MRELEATADVEVAILSERRRRAPAGLAGGGDGQVGRNVRVSRDGDETPLPGKWQGRLQAGERLRIETPGGGGWGA